MSQRYLSRKDIEKIAKDVIQYYKSIMVPEKHLCYSVDPMALAHILNISVDFQHLTTDYTVLGMTTPSESCVTILSPAGEPFMYYLDGATILIEKKLIQHPHLKGRLNFTIAHEIAHQIIFHMFPDEYSLSYKAYCDYRRTESVRPRINDWEEWQADTLGSALLMPEDAVRDNMFFHGLGEKLNILSPKYSPNKYFDFCRMAESMGTSKSALSIRMEQLGLLERNLLHQK